MEQRKVTMECPEITLRVFGSFDANVRTVEETFGVRIYNRAEEDGDALTVCAEDAESVRLASEALRCLADMARHNETLTEQQVLYVVGMVKEGHTEGLASLEQDCICLTVKGKPIKAKTVGQKQYVNAINKNTVVFGIGPAGTGKTFLAVAMAVKALRDKQVSRIILTRPAIEAGEKLGFLPGDLQSKIDPYLRPLYDALFAMMGAENYARHIEKGIIEIAPLAYMRGRTLDDSFIILDEAQNATPEQMKMFLTRLGFNAKAVVTGDLTQTDLPAGQRSGLSVAVKILEGIDDIAVHRFSDRDVVRHKLVQQIIRAYEKHDRELAEKRQSPKKGQDRKG